MTLDGVNSFTVMFVIYFLDTSEQLTIDRAIVYWLWLDILYDFTNLLVV